MKFSKLYLIFALTFNIFAAVDDVKPKNLEKGSLYVKVEKVTQDLIKFEKCRWQIENSCQTLGHKDSYTMEELRSQRTQENWEIAGSIVGDVITVAAGIFVGTYGTALALGSATSQVNLSLGLLSGGPVGGIVGGIISKYVSALNPVTQTRQAKALNEEIIQDQDAVVNDIEKFVNRLNLVLSKID